MYLTNTLELSLPKGLRSCLAEWVFGALIGTQAAYVVSDTWIVFVVQTTQTISSSLGTQLYTFSIDDIYTFQQPNLYMNPRGWQCYIQRIEKAQKNPLGPLDQPLILMFPSCLPGSLPLSIHTSYPPQYTKCPFPSQIHSHPLQKQLNSHPSSTTQAHP